jgi:hypothetical protein
MHKYLVLLYSLFPVICFQSEKEKSKLYCWYERKKDLAWLINPLKVEVYSWEPFLVQFYDVIGNKTIDFLKESAIPIIHRATTLRSQNDNDTAFNYESMYRTSSSTSMYEFRSDLQPLDRMIGRITQLAVSNVGDPAFASEQWQVSSYAFGGEFGPHNDAVRRLLVTIRYTKLSRICTANKISISPL